MTCTPCAKCNSGCARVQVGGVLLCQECAADRDPATEDME